MKINGVLSLFTTYEKADNCFNKLKPCSKLVFQGVNQSLKILNKKRDAYGVPGNLVYL